MRSWIAWTVVSSLTPPMICSICIRWKSASAGGAAAKSNPTPAAKDHITMCALMSPSWLVLELGPSRRAPRRRPRAVWLQGYAGSRWTGQAPWGKVPAMAKSPFSLEGKTAIVTGGGTGIGKSIALEFARAGADVALCSRKLEHLEPVVKAVRDVGKRSFAMAVDVRQEDQVKAMVDRAVQEWGRLDIMVNNAGASFRAKPEDISVNGWNTVVGINLTGAFLGCTWAGRQMMQQQA